MNKVILVVLDGYGIAPAGPGNAVTLAKPQTLESLYSHYPHTNLEASGESVGLPRGEMGSSEVGHVNLGAGRIVPESLARINMSIADGSFFKNKAFLTAFNHVKQNNSRLHIVGLLASGEVHASIDHLYALLFLAKEAGIREIFIHVITDGRDSLPRAGITYIEALQNHLKRLEVGTIASIMGRYYALDRDHRWERTQKAYQCLTGKNYNQIENPVVYVQHNYQKNITDEFIEPAAICKDGNPIGKIEENDAVIFYNFRVDRPRQLTKAFVLDNFEHDANLITDYDPYASKYYSKHILNNDEVVLNPPFARGDKIKNLLFVTMTQYEENLPVTVAYPPEIVQLPLGEIISQQNLYQLRLAESEKERFVTYYFNGFNKVTYNKEDRIIIPSVKISTYDKKPEMSAADLTELLISKIKENVYSFILLNFANPDMVAHTGNIDATISAIKTTDGCIGKIIESVVETDYYLIITSDHGHAEAMLDPKTQQLSTSHTTNLVPFIIVHPSLKGKPVSLQPGILADVAVTILKLMDINIPSIMTGRNLLETDL